MSKNLINNLKSIINNKVHIHHSHIDGEIIDHAHSYCNEKIRENKSEISVIAHNLFRLDFFFLLKGIRARVWRTKDISIRGKNPTNISFASIGNQQMFLDTIKYFQQSLGALASNLTDIEKAAIRKEYKKFIEKDPCLDKKFNLCTEEDQEWVLDYLLTGKGTTPYEMITCYDSYITFKIPLFFVRFLSSNQSNFKGFSDTILENVILQVHLVVVHKEIKVNV